MDNEVRKDLMLVCAALNKHHVDYLIIGGIAVGYHGYRRISGISVYRPEIKNDFDFWYNPTTENFHLLTKALADLGVSKESLDNIVFDPKKTFLKIPHDKFHTDFLPQMIGVESFKQCKSRAVKDSLDGTELYVIGYDDLMANKLALNRPIDRDDINHLKK
jgi:hypothetical protein